MAQDELPIYDPKEQGLTEDFQEHSAEYEDRKMQAARYNGSKQALARMLKDGGLSDRAVMSGGFKPHPPEAQDNYAVIYLRVSSEEQAKKGGTAEGYSIPFQREACRKKAAEMGLIIVEEYVDAGHSAKSTRRPDLQRMLSELRPKKVEWVIIHKIDRLARNRRDDYRINEAIQTAGACLVSVVDLVDDTPQGRFNYTIQAGLAQLYSDNLAVEVMKGLMTKVKSGGTPYRVPVGYMNKRRIDDNADIRWVEVDPERGWLITWAFKEYATGDWSISQLCEALTAKGFLTRGTAKASSRPISVGGLHKILSNPYYAGIVPYMGAYYEGDHEPLIDVQTWLLVQDVLHARNAAGNKDRVHAHYLKGSVFCGACGSRLVFSRNKGRGGTYDYFFCMGRKNKRNRCLRSAVRVRAVEAGVVEFYNSFQLGRERAAQIQAAVLVELEESRKMAARDEKRAKRRLVLVDDQRQKLMEAHYSEAVPLDLLKAEMQRLMREKALAESELRAAQASVTDLEAQLARAMIVAGNAGAYYGEATPAVRRLMNQGFFEKLLIGQDGSVEHQELTEPFAQLMDYVEERGERVTGSQTAPPSVGLDKIEIENTPGQFCVVRGVIDEFVAEGVGFEPTRARKRPSGFQDRRHRPLGEPSWSRAQPYRQRGRAKPSPTVAASWR
jgi:site-specific DNA recombinase